MLQKTRTLNLNTTKNANASNAHALGNATATATALRKPQFRHNQRGGRVLRTRRRRIHARRRRRARAIAIRVCDSLRDAASERQTDEIPSGTRQNGSRSVGRSVCYLATRRAESGAGCCSTTRCPHTIRKKTPSWCRIRTTSSNFHSRTCRAKCVAREARSIWFIDENSM